MNISSMLFLRTYAGFVASELRQFFDDVTYEQSCVSAPLEHELETVSLRPGKETFQEVSSPQLEPRNGVC